MKDYKLTESEKQINRVLKYQEEQLNSIHFNPHGLDDAILEAENTLISLGRGKEIEKLGKSPRRNKALVEAKPVKVPSWESLCKEANEHIKKDVPLSALFTEEELLANEKYIKKLNDEFNALHKLDKIDITISAVAGIVSAAIDLLLVGIPTKTADGLKAGPLSNYVRQWFEKKFPPEEMERLGGQSRVKVPYDAQDNRNTSVWVEGLSSYYHRLLQPGHDPILGFFVGVFDIMNGRMTTIDKSGKIVSQVMDCYSGRKETTLFAAITKQILHLKSDITTSMGLPAPLMSLFNLCQFGEIGDEDQTVAEIVQGMYYEGYDFIHFCSMSIPVMVAEVIVRVAYFFKRRHEGFSIKESLPISTSHKKNPKLGTMLFIAHSAAAAINAGKVAFTENPMAINYPQWLAFAKYSYSELKWALIQKPNLRHQFVMDKLSEEYKQVYADIDNCFNEMFRGRMILEV